MHNFQIHLIGNPMIFHYKSDYDLGILHETIRRANGITVSQDDGQVYIPYHSISFIGEL